MREGNLQIKALQESIEIIDEIDYDKLKDQLRYQLNELAKNQWNAAVSSRAMVRCFMYVPPHIHLPPHHSGADRCPPLKSTYRIRWAPFLFLT